MRPLEPSTSFSETYISTRNDTIAAVAIRSWPLNAPATFSSAISLDSTRASIPRNSRRPAVRLEEIVFWLRKPPDERIPEKPYQHRDDADVRAKERKERDLRCIWLRSWRCCRHRPGKSCAVRCGYPHFVGLSFVPLKWYNDFGFCKPAEGLGRLYSRRQYPVVDVCLRYLDSFRPGVPDVRRYGTVQKLYPFYCDIRQRDAGVEQAATGSQQKRDHSAKYHQRYDCACNQFC